jgi:hypothetical protein
MKAHVILLAASALVLAAASDAVRAQPFGRAQGQAGRGQERAEARAEPRRETRAEPRAEARGEARGQYRAAPGPTYAAPRAYAAPPAYAPPRAYTAPPAYAYPPPAYGYTAPPAYSYQRAAPPAYGYAPPPGSAAANSLGAGWGQQQDAARRGVRQEGLMPLSQVMSRIQRGTPGRLLDAGLEPGPSGRPAYRVRWAAAGGRRIDFIVDAATGAIIGQSGY